MKTVSWTRKCVGCLALALVLLLAIWGGAGMALRFLSSGRIYEFSELGCVPKKRAAVVLGCAKKVHGGLVNLYYARRIESVMQRKT